MEATILPLLLSLASPAHAADACPILPDILERIEKRFEQRKFQQAHDLRLQALDSFTCGAPPLREDLARFFLAHGAMEYVAGKRDEALVPMAAAANLMPGMWVMAYGNKVRLVYEDAAVGVSGNGTVTMDPGPPEDTDMYVDGTKVDDPAEVVAGMHLLQVVRDNETIFSKMVIVPEDSSATVPYVEPEPAKEKKPKKTKVPKKVKGLETETM